MANTVISLRSSGATSNTPSLGVLANGELSLNFSDGILYYKTAANTLGSIRTTQASGLNKEIQFNDSGSFGSNASLTFDKANTTLATNNFVANTITTGTGVGGIIAGANVIYANTFVANTGGYVEFSDGSKQYTANAGSTTLAQAAFDKANTDVTSISATDGVYGNATYVPVITLSANGRISSITNTAISGGTSVDSVARTTANAAFDAANSANVLAQAAFDFANTANIKVDSAYAFANIANTTADASFAKANAANVLAQASFDFANTANIKVDSAFAFANIANIKVDAAFTQANAANVLAQAAFDKANTSNTTADASFAKANAANVLAESAFVRANNSLNVQSGGSVTGDVTVTGNLTVVGQTVYANTATVVIADNILTLNAAINQASAPTVNAGIEIDRGSSDNVSILWNETSDTWTFTNDGSNYLEIADAARLNSAFALANTANTTADAGFAKANSANVIAQAAFDFANTANIKVDSAYAFANTVNIKVDSAYAFANVANVIAQAAFDFANTANIKVDSAYAFANVANTIADASFAKANAANVLAQAAFDKANTGGGLANTGTSVTANGLTQYTFANTTASTSNSTGAIISNGGLVVKGNVYADAVYDGGIEVILFANQAFNLANTANVLAQAAFDKANTDTTSITATTGVYGNASIVPVFTLNANGRVSVVTNTAIALAASAITSGTLSQNTTGSANSFTSTTQNSQFNSLGVGTAASGTGGEIRATNNITAYYSDRRLKENIEKLQNALDKIKQISGVTFNANDKAAKYGYTDKKKQVGVIAQEIEQVLPEIVVPAPFDIAKNQDGIEYSISGENYKTVQYEKIVPLLIEAIKELDEKLEFTIKNLL